MPDNSLTLTSMIVASFLGKNPTSRADLSALSQTVHTALTEAASPGPEPEVPQAPAVSLRKSITPDAIICMDCGKPFKSLRRHLETAHNLSPADYVEKWSLPETYPLVAQTYSAARSAFAKSIGLGARSRAARLEKVSEESASEITPAATPDESALPVTTADSAVEVAEESPGSELATTHTASKPAKAAAKAEPHPKPSATPKPRRTRAAKSTGL